MSSEKVENQVKRRRVEIFGCGKDCGKLGTFVENSII